MPNNKTLMVIAVTALLVLVLYPKISNLPGVNKIPTV